MKQHPRYQKFTALACWLTGLMTGGAALWIVLQLLPSQSVSQEQLRFEKRFANRLTESMIMELFPELWVEDTGPSQQVLNERINNLDLQELAMGCRSVRDGFPYSGYSISAKIAIPALLSGPLTDETQDELLSRYWLRIDLVSPDQSRSESFLARFNEPPKRISEIRDGGYSSWISNEELAIGVWHSTMGD